MGAKLLILYYAVSTLMLCMFAILKLLQNIKWMEKPIVQLLRNISTIEMRKESYWDGLFGWKMFKSQQNCLFKHLFKDAQEGFKAPNPAVLSADGKKTLKMLDIARGARPLIVNFGSCTCPVFMERLKEFWNIVEEYKTVADFLMVYIEEAHPSDEWKLEGNFEIVQHRNQQERCNAARILLQTNLVHPNCLLTVDTMTNRANTAYGALPIRLAIIQNDKVQYAGGLGPTLYKTADVDNWLSQYRKGLAQRKWA